MYKREISNSILSASKKMPVIVLTGPRQSGKTTIVKSLFNSYQYVNLEYPDLREYAQNDPRGFLHQYKQGLIIDEIQHVPELFSYIQAIVDEKPENGKYILTGSQNFLFLQSVSQSLAGRAAIFYLLPLSISELSITDQYYHDYEDYIFKGFYPRIYDQNLNPTHWLLNYIQTYLERDVRQIINIKDLAKFQLLLRICVGRIGQMINFSALSNEIGVDSKTIKSWMSILETSFIIYFLNPYFKNFNKRLVKTPKLYFHDTGLACALLDIKSVEQLNQHYLKGSLFENMIISEFQKEMYNQGNRQLFYFWRDNTGNEIDCIFEKGSEIVPIEIKSSRTIQPSFFKGLNFWQKISGQSNTAYLIYGGDLTQKRNNIEIIGWKLTKTIL